jgi:peptidyl-prolyl cis-trans isomerase B (cyclophilin B)
MKIKLSAFLLFICLLFCLCGCESGLPYEKDEKLYSTHTAMMTIKDFGEVKLELYGDIAPVTVANFVKLINNGFYNGLTFHRAIEGYMIQGGDPNGDGTGGSDKTIKGEFRLNGFENNLKHICGVVSMARLGHDMNSASSQIFICTESNQKAASLNGGYAGFGYVVSGIEVVKSIAKVPTGQGDKPLTDVVIEKACFVNVNQ